MVNIVNTVKSSRERLGLTQQELAARSGVGRTTISNIETGRYCPGVDVAIKLCRVLGKPVEEVFRIPE